MLLLLVVERMWQMLVASAVEILVVEVEAYAGMIELLIGRCVVDCLL